MRLAAVALLVIPLALLFAGCAGKQAPKLDIDPALAGVLDKLYAASGGLEQIKAVQTVKATGKFMTQGMEFPFTTQNKRPMKFHLESNVMGMEFLQVFDGESGWAINPMTGSSDPEPMGEFENKNFKMQADLDGPLIDFQDKGYTVALVGDDEIEGTAVHHVTIDTHTDMTMDIYIDQEFNLMTMIRTKMLQEGNEIVIETYMSDYADTGGLMSARSIENRVGGNTQSQIVIETIEYGVEVDDAIFVMPATEEAEAKAGGDG